MLHNLRRSIKQIFDKHPLIANCLTYGTFTTSAEFIQQTLSVNKECDGRSTVDKKVSISLYLFILMSIILIDDKTEEIVYCDSFSGL